MRENQFLISCYLLSLADLEATKEVGEQIKENLRKLGIKSELAKPEDKRRDGPREGSIVLTLSMNLENWFVTDVSFSTMR